MMSLLRPSSYFGLFLTKKYQHCFHIFLLLLTPAFSFVLLKDGDLAGAAGDDHPAQVGVGHTIRPTDRFPPGGASMQRGTRW